jgi:hypothetical protein
MPRAAQRALIGAWPARPLLTKGWSDRTLTSGATGEARESKGSRSAALPRQLQRRPSALAPVVARDIEIRALETSDQDAVVKLSLRAWAPNYASMKSVKRAALGLRSPIMRRRHVVRVADSRLRRREGARQAGAGGQEGYDLRSVTFLTGDAATRSTSASRPPAITVSWSTA